MILVSSLALFKALAKAGRQPTASIASAVPLAGSLRAAVMKRSVQVRSVDFETGVIELLNCADAHAAAPFKAWN